MADPDEPWDILWYSAFETTALLTALFVATFTFIKDPTGRQDERDASEIHIFKQWRRAILVIWMDLALKAAVLVVQVANRKPVGTI